MYYNYSDILVYIFCNLKTSDLSNFESQNSFFKISKSANIVLTWRDDVSMLEQFIGGEGELVSESSKNLEIKKVNQQKFYYTKCNIQVNQYEIQVTTTWNWSKLTLNSSKSTWNRSKHNIKIT